MAPSTKSQLPIAQLQPSIESDNVYARGVITVVWPYSASTQAWGFLLVDPDFRLRRQRGQVRISFHGPCARRTARCGLASGDEINLSIAGAQWREDAAQDQTPGKSVGWELSYDERVVLEVCKLFRTQNGMSNVVIQKTIKNGEPLLVDSDHMSPSPEPARSLLSLTPPETPNGIAQTPVQKSVSHLEANNTTWSSPAFLKVKEPLSLSLLGRTVDLFWDDQDTWDADRPTKRAKFGRSSGQWRFVERTPSPEVEAEPELSNAIMPQDPISEDTTRRPEGDAASWEVQDSDDMARGDSPISSNRDAELEKLEPNQDLARPREEATQSSIESAREGQILDVEYPELRDPARSSSIETEVITYLPDPTPSIARSPPQSFRDGQSIADAQPRSSPFETTVSSPKLETSPPLPPEAMISFREKSPGLRIDIQGATPRMDNLPDDEVQAPDTPRLQPLPSPGLNIVSPIETRSQVPAAFFDQQRNFLRGSALQMPQAVTPSSKHEPQEDNTASSDGAGTSSTKAPEGELATATSASEEIKILDSGILVPIENLSNATRNDSEIVPQKDISASAVNDADEPEGKSSIDPERKHSYLTLPKSSKDNTNTELLVNVDLVAQNAEPGQTQDTDIQTVENIEPATDHHETLYYNIPGLSGNADTPMENLEDRIAEETKIRHIIEKEDSLFQEMMAYIDDDDNAPTTTPHVEAQEDKLELEMDEALNLSKTRGSQEHIDPALQAFQSEHLESSATNTQRVFSDLEYGKEPPSHLNSIQEIKEGHPHAIDIDAAPRSLSPEEDQDMLEYEVPDTYVDEEDLPYSSVTEETPTVRRAPEVIDLVGSHETESSLESDKLEDNLLADKSASDRSKSPSASPDRKAAVQVVVEKTSTRFAIDENQESDAEPSRQDLATSSDMDVEPEEPQVESVPDYTMPSSLPPPASQRSRPLTRAQSKFAGFGFSDEEDSSTPPTIIRDFAPQYPQTPEASQRIPENSLSRSVDLKTYDEPSLPTPRPTQRSVADLDEDSRSPEYYTAPSETKIHESDGNQRTSQIEDSQAASTIERAEDVKSLRTEDTNTDPLSQQAPSLLPSSATAAKMNLASTAPKSQELHASAEPPLGLRTPLSYYVPLPSLHQYVNDRIDVLAICVSATKPVKAKSGRRDFLQTLYLSDPSSSTMPTTITTANLFRPFDVALPSPTLGEVILLRECKVESRQKKMMLSSTSTSSWALWRRNADGEAAGMEVKGPPIEVGPEERGVVRGLSAWWDSLDKGFRDRIEAGVPSSAKRKGNLIELSETISQQESEGREVEESRGKRKKEDERTRKDESNKATVETEVNTKADTQPITAKKVGKYQLREREKRTPEPTKSSHQQQTPESARRSSREDVAPPSSSSPPPDADEDGKDRKRVREKKTSEPIRSSPRNKATTALSTSSPSETDKMQKGKREKRKWKVEAPEPTRSSKRQRKATVSSLSTSPSVDQEETDGEKSQPTTSNNRKGPVAASLSPPKHKEQEKGRSRKRERETAAEPTRSSKRQNMATASSTSTQPQVDEEETEEKSPQHTARNTSPRLVQSLQKSNAKHTLRSGMKYSDEVPAPRPKSRGKGAGNDVVHELRDGRKWTDPGV